MMDWSLKRFIYEPYFLYWFYASTEVQANGIVQLKRVQRWIFFFFLKETSVRESTAQ